jgi:hypothetical protein
MDPAYRSTISNQKERSKKRSNTNTDISRMIEEERESKRNRLSQHTGGQSMYAQTPPGLYQQHMTEPDYDQVDVYADNDSMAGSSQQYTPVERPLSNAQQKTQDRQQNYQKLVSGLGESMLAPRAAMAGPARPRFKMRISGTDLHLSSSTAVMILASRKQTSRLASSTATEKPRTA